jgi:hypothetical protein
MFRQYIVDPFFSVDKDPYRNLQRLLQSVCLRRLQNQSSYPTTHDQVFLTLSHLEKELYDEILEETKMKMDALISTGSPFQRNAQLFTAMQRLRRLCSLGQLSEEPISLPLSNSSSPGRTSFRFDNGQDFGCELCTKEDSRDLMKDLAFCPDCSRLLANVPSENAEMSSRNLGTELLRGPRSSYLFEASVSADRCRATSPESLMAIDPSPDKYPTKLLEVAARLVETIHQSKRFDEPSKGPYNCFT